MDAAEKALFIKFLDSLVVSENTDTEKKEVEGYVSEPNEYIEKLKKRASLLATVSDFNVGDIAVWKDGLKNKRYPQYGQPAIVLEKLDPPLIDDEDLTLKEVLNIKLGFIAENDEFFSFNYDGNRFKTLNL